MSDETRLAFAHPEERAIATASDTGLDRISLRDHIVSVEIGAFQAERGITQRLSFNIVVEVRHISADLADDVDLILSYDRVTEAIDIELAAERLNLLETLAERIADRILIEPQAERVFVRIEKLDRGGGALGVEIVRTGQEGKAPLSEDALQCQIAYLSNDAVKSPNLTDWIAQLSAREKPLVICVPAPNDARTQVGASLAQNRIDLLSVEQNAWALAAQINGLAVVGTRTEMDWAIKNNQPCVWAPSKFVFDAVPAPLHLINDPVALTLWFAGQVDAADVILIGEDMPVDPKLPCRAVPLMQEQI
ncbi:dihydroneopterin aldolase [Planktotalea sp.]|uniref:dihydroneopterin aldolase n=1 Tax=Planktotalea sp. TaxID=2029877 RepID=UPI00329A6763